MNEQDQLDDPYDVLHITPDADEREIRAAYLKDQGGTKEEFQQLAAAYELIGDPEKRKLFDRYGHRRAAAGRRRNINKSPQQEERSRYFDYSAVGGSADRDHLRGTFFDFEKDDDAYFSTLHQMREERRQQADELKKRTQEQKAKRRAEHSLRVAEQPLKNHQKCVKKNLKKIVGKVVQTKFEASSFYIYMWKEFKEHQEFAERKNAAYGWTRWPPTLLPRPLELDPEEQVQQDHLCAKMLSDPAARFLAREVVVTFVDPAQEESLLKWADHLADDKNQLERCAEAITSLQKACDDWEDKRKKLTTWRSEQAVLLEDDVDALEEHEEDNDGGAAPASYFSCVESETSTGGGGFSSAGAGAVCPRKNKAGRRPPTAFEELKNSFPVCGPLLSPVEALRKIVYGPPAAPKGGVRSVTSYMVKIEGQVFDPDPAAAEAIENAQGAEPASQEAQEELVSGVAAKKPKKKSSKQTTNLALNKPSVSSAGGAARAQEQDASPSASSSDGAGSEGYWHRCRLEEDALALAESMGIFGIYDRKRFTEIFKEAPLAMQEGGELLQWAMNKLEYEEKCKSKKEEVEPARGTGRGGQQKSKSEMKKSGGRVKHELQDVNKPHPHASTGPTMQKSRLNFSDTFTALACGAAPAENDDDDDKVAAFNRMNLKICDMATHADYRDDSVGKMSMIDELMLRNYGPSGTEAIQGGAPAETSCTPPKVYRLDDVRKNLAGAVQKKTLPLTPSISTNAGAEGGGGGVAILGTAAAREAAAGAGRKSDHMKLPSPMKSTTPLLLENVDEDEQAEWPTLRQVPAKKASKTAADLGNAAQPPAKSTANATTSPAPKKTSKNTASAKAVPRAPATAINGNHTNASPSTKKKGDLEWVLFPLQTVGGDLMDADALEQDPGVSTVRAKVELKWKNENNQESTEIEWIYGSAISQLNATNLAQVLQLVAEENELPFRYAFGEKYPIVANNSAGMNMLSGPAHGHFASVVTTDAAPNEPWTSEFSVADLDFSRCSNFDDECAKILFSWLIQCRIAVRVLKLYKCKLGNKGMDYLAEYMRKLEEGANSKFFDVDMNPDPAWHKKDDVAKEKALHILEEIHLSDNAGITELGCFPLFAFLEKDTDWYPRVKMQRKSAGGLNAGWDLVLHPLWLRMNNCSINTKCPAFKGKLECKISGTGGALRVLKSTGEPQHREYKIHKVFAGCDAVEAWKRARQQRPLKLWANV
eukprot:g16956.t1